MNRLLVVMALCAALATPARADAPGAVIGGVSGFFMAGPPGAIVGVIVGAIWGKPWWGPDESASKCWIDDNFSRHCPHSLVVK